MPVLYLYTKVKCPAESDLTRLDRVMGFINLTKHKRRLISRDENMEKFFEFIDVSFSVHDDGKGHTGLVKMWGNVAVAMVSKKQKIGTKDSTESEMVALTDMIEKVEWVHEYSKEQGYEIKIPVIYEDNTSTIALVMKDNNPKLRTRHLTARRCIASEFIVKDKKASIEFKKTTEMLADTLTKPVVGHLFYKLNNIMMGWLKLWPAQSIRVKGVRWKNRDVGVGSPAENNN